jgi:hypothetical protein
MPMMVRRSLISDSILPENMQQLQLLTRQPTRLLWQMAQAGAPLEGEQAILVEVMREYPEYADLWERLDELSDADIKRDGVNPILYVQMPAVVENQIAQREPAEVRETVRARLRQGFDRHEARYLRKLRKLTR